MTRKSQSYKDLGEEGGMAKHFKLRISKSLGRKEGDEGVKGEG